MGSGSCLAMGTVADFVRHSVSIRRERLEIVGDIPRVRSFACVCGGIAFLPDTQALGQGISALMGSFHHSRSNLLGDLPLLFRGFRI